MNYHDQIWVNWIKWAFDLIIFELKLKEFWLDYFNLKLVILDHLTQWIWLSPHQVMD